MTKTSQQQSLGRPGRASSSSIYPFRRIFDSERKQPPHRVAVFCSGAGYGNRTRLCGLGSDRSTDELTLHVMVIIPDGKGKFKSFLGDFPGEVGGFPWGSPFSSRHFFRPLAQAPRAVLRSLPFFLACPLRVRGPKFGENSSIGEFAKIAIEIYCRQ